MKLVFSLTAAVAAAATLAMTAGAHIPRTGCTSKLPARVELRCATLNLKHAHDVVRWATNQQRHITVYGTAASETLLLHHLIESHGWLARIMAARVAEAHARMARVLPETNDWLTAIRLVQHAYPGSGPWLESCSAGEGSHGQWVWNGGQPLVSTSHGSGAGGWMQYMEGTFEHDFDRALADVRARGYVVPSSAASWYSPLGQALAGGWAYGHDRPSGKWTGGGC